MISDISDTSRAPICSAEIGEKYSEFSESGDRIGSNFAPEQFLRKPAIEISSPRNKIEAFRSTSLHHGGAAMPKSAQTIRSPSAAQRKSQAAKPGKEIFLHLPCPACGQAISVPLDTLGTHQSCPDCAADIEIPGLDASVSGLDAVFHYTRFFTHKEQWDTACPGCGDPVRVSVDTLGQPFSCGLCHSPLIVTIMPQAQPVAAAVPPSGTTSPSSAAPNHGATAPGQAPASAPPSAPPPPDQPRPAASGDSSDTSDADATAPFDIDTSAATQDGDYYSGAGVTRRRSTMSPRATRLWTYFLLHWAPVLVLWGLSVLCSLAYQQPRGVYLFCIGVPWLLFGFSPCWWLSHKLMPFFISTLHCPRCGFDHDAVGIWSSGGYTDHKERHIYRFRNPLDGSRVGHTDCPQCGSTILL